MLYADKKKKRNAVGNPRIVLKTAHSYTFRTQYVTLIKLNDLRDRLEHSEATNRSMQSYVNFLKSSYQNTFGDDLTSAD